MEPIRLTREKETLLVPLYSKALESRRESPIIRDPKAAEILDAIEYDFAGLGVPRQTLVTLAMRAKKLDACVREYIERVDSPLVIHLGCGLDSRVLRALPEPADTKTVHWFDIDFPDVIDLRRRFYDESGTRHMIGSSVTAWSWLEKVCGAANIEPGDRPAMVVAEGLFMYLAEQDIRELFDRVRRTFPRSEIVFDAYSALTARSAGRHPSIRKTGAEIRWGIDRAEEIEKWGDSIRLLEEWTFPESEDIPNLPRGFRVVFRIAGAFAAARRAHRVLRYQL